MILKKLLGDSIPFSEREKKLIIKLIEIYNRENASIASFVYCIGAKKVEECNGELDLSNLNFKWIFDHEQRGLMGAWNLLTPNTIYIANHGIGSVDNYDGRYDQYGAQPMRDHMSGDVNHCMVLGALLTNFPIVMHELYHMFQFKGCPIGYVMMRLVTVFTKLPYYLAQTPVLAWACPDGENTGWVQFWNKLTVWDLEGQAEKYGDKDPGMLKFCKAMHICAAWEYYQRCVTNDQKRIAAGKEPNYAQEDLDRLKATTIADYGGEKYWNYAAELHQWCKN